MPGSPWDYVVVGSGAGGGTVAARLAENGSRVLVLEAGGDPGQEAARSDRPPAEDYAVPAFHPFASENPGISWRVFVNHYADPQQAARDWKCGPNGVLYPRGSTLGGSTAHNAMIFMRPHESDWNHIAELTGDASWRAAGMDRYFRRVEACRYRAPLRWLARLGINPSGHGWRGWLTTESCMPLQAMLDGELMQVVLESTLADVCESPPTGRDLGQLLDALGDPNDRRRLGCDGPCYMPLSTRGHRRMGARERLLEAQAAFPDRLAIETDALVARVVLDETLRAVGVEFLKGADLYRACAQPSGDSGEPRTVMANREVILAAGAFNTPQILMLSGIGANDEIAAAGVTTRVDSPGVGRNLQDRYEISVVNRMASDWRSLAGARFEAGDPLWQAWRSGSGMYGSNGAALGAIARSRPDRADPDLFAMAMIARFEGYFEGYSQRIAEHHDYLSWAILKAHTLNRSGVVRLASADPRDPPRVEFNYFDSACDPEGEDLAAVVTAIRNVRRLTAPLIAQGCIAAEEKPGPDIATDEDLSQFVRDNAWGHHACGTAAIGPLASGGVLDSDFRVHGVRGLRVVDASAFPRIPGFFIAAPTYAIAEKAAEVMTRDARSTAHG